MDNIKEIEERSDFFDENEEERIQALMNKGYKSGLTDSSFTKRKVVGKLQTTEEFMREMGVFNSDVMTNKFKATDSAKKQQYLAHKSSKLHFFEQENQNFNNYSGYKNQQRFNEGYLKNIGQGIPESQSYNQMNDGYPFNNKNGSFMINQQSQNLNYFNKYQEDLLKQNQMEKTLGINNRDLGNLQMNMENESERMSVGDQVSVDNGEELSYYGLDIISIADLIRSQNLLEFQNRTISSLRIMHCDNFCNINGIQIKLFQNLTELNLSSNNIEDIGELQVLKNVQILNLSCNKITQIKGLDSMIFSLNKLILSHNRITSLQYFKQIIQNGQSAPNLQILDLNDNYIGDLSHIQYLKPITSLKDLIFQQNGSCNPICDFMNYQETILNELPQITKLDGKSIYNLGVLFKNQKAQPSNQVLNSYNSHLSLVEFSKNNEIKEMNVEHNFQQQQHKMKSANKNNEYELMNQQFHEQLQSLTNRLATAIQDRDSSIKKFYENEEIWKKKDQKNKENNKQLIILNEELKDNNKQLFIEIDKYTKRIRQLENDVEKEKEQIKEMDHQIHDLRKDKCYIQEQLQEKKDELFKVQKQHLDVQHTFELTDQKLKDTLLQLKNAEEKCHQLYQDLMDTKSNNIEKWSEHQKRYDDSQDVISKQLTIIEELNNKITDLKDAYNQLDYSWSQKYQDMNGNKDQEIHESKQKLIDQDFQLNQTFKEEIRKMKIQFKEDIIVLDKELSKQIQQKKELFQQNEVLKEKQAELIDLTKAAALSEEKKSSLLAEIKIVVQKERDNLKIKEEQLNKDKAQIDEYKSIKQEEILALKRELDDEIFKNKELKMKMETIQERYIKLEADLRLSNRNQQECQNELNNVLQQYEKLKIESTNYEDQLKRELEDARMEQDDLSDLLKTKDKMLEDQNIVIAGFKEKIKEKDEEIKQMAESKNKNRDFYEKKIQEEIEENEKHRQKSEDLYNQLQNTEYEYDQLKQDLQDYQDQLQQCKDQLKDKDQVIEFVEQEVTKIKEKQDEDRQEVNEKEEQIQNQNQFIEQLQQDIEVKNQEIKILLERIDLYKKHKDEQIEQLKDLLKKAQNDIKVLVNDHEKQKQKAAEKIKLLSEIFKED